MVGLTKNYIVRVRTSKNTLEPFDVQKIVDSLVSETQLNKKHAAKVGKEVSRELSRMRLDYVTAPLIREIVNVKLLEHGFENARARYTRLGMPVYDVRKLLEKGINGNGPWLYNPETVHKLMADQMAREYTLLNVLPMELADAHMSGEIHIHDLSYFPTRPYSFSHDFRFFLKNGIKPDGLGELTSVSGPAKKPAVAFMHAAKVLASAQTNCAGGQALSYLNVYLAPYVRGLGFAEVRQLAQMFVYELSQMYGTRGGQVVYSSVDCCLEIPEFLAKCPAVTPGGAKKKGAVYGDFEREARLILEALVDVYSEGDMLGRPFYFPKLNVILNAPLDKHIDVIESLMKLSLRNRAPHFVVPRGYMPDYLSFMASSFLLQSPKKIKSAVSKSFIRGGVMQLVAVNLPQIAFESKGGESRLYELLGLRVWRARQALLLKKQIIEKNIKHNLLPFLGQEAGDGSYLSPDSQSYVVGFVGLNEMAKLFTGFGLGEDDCALDFGLKVVGRMRDIVDGMRKDSGINFVLSGTPSMKCGKRLSEVDGIRFGSSEFGAYTNSFRPSADVRLSAEEVARIESKFHPLCFGGAFSPLPVLGFSSVSKLLDYTSCVVSGSELQYFAYI